MRKSKSEGSNRLLSAFVDFVLAACAACSLVLDMNLLSGNIFFNWGTAFPNTPAVTVVFCAVFALLQLSRRHLQEQGWGIRVLSIFLGMWWVLARSVYNTQDINQPFLNSGQLLKSLVTVLGTACIYDLLFRVLAHALKAWMKMDLGDAETCLLIRWYRRRTTIACALAVFAMWLPHIAISYPCSMNNDTAVQVMQALGLEKRVANHPPFGTMLIEMALNAGRMLGSYSVGLYIYVLLQCVFAALVVGYSQSVMRRLGAPQWLRLGSLLVCGLMPVYCDNVTVILKDIPYAYAAVLLLCEAVRVRILQEKDYAASAGHLLRVAIAGVILMNIRNNGLGIYLPVTIILNGYAFRDNRRMLQRTMMVMLLPFVLTACIETALNKTNDIAPRSIREGLSLPFQQTARFVRDHEDQVTPQEREAINAVLEYDGIGVLYDPLLSDPVKATYKEEATTQDLIRYFKAWGSQLLKEPLCYAKATLIQNALLFDPQTYNVAIFHGTGLFEEAKKVMGVYKPEICVRLEGMEELIHWLLFTLPLIPQLNSLGFHCILLVGALCLAKYNRVKDMGVVFWPMIVVLVMLVLGPCIDRQDRYGFPILYNMPLILACLSYCMRSMKKE